MVNRINRKRCGAPTAYRILRALDACPAAAARLPRVGEEDTPPDELDTFRPHLQRQYAFGSNRFRAAIEAQLARHAGPAKIGRPHQPQRLAKW